MLNTKNLNIRKIIFSTLLFLFLISIDQTIKILISKMMIEQNFSEKNVFSFLNIVFVRNTGISFGLFSDGGMFNRYFFSIFSILVGSVLFIISFLSEKKLIFYALTIISAGAFGNAIDRMYFGGVIDFIDIFVYNYHWPAFNFADIFITVGVLILLLDNLLSNEK